MNSFGYLVRLPVSAAAPVRFRLLPIRAAWDETQECLWLRSLTEDEEATQALMTLPGSHFHIDSANRLTPVGHQLHTADLPRLSWTSLREYAAVELPVAQWLQATVPVTSLRLIPDRSSTAADALFTDINRLRSFVENAAEVRLQSLRFAMTGAGQVFVIGRPLPSAAGTRFVIREQIAVPAGMAWTPRLAPSSVRSVFLRREPSEQASRDDLIVWESTGSWHIIPQDAFVAVTRASVKASASVIAGEV